MSIFSIKSPPVVADAKPYVAKQSTHEESGKEEDDKKGLKSQLHGQVESLNASLLVLRAPLALDTLSPTAQAQREVHTHAQVDKKVSHLLSQEKKAAAEETKKEQKSKELSVKISALKPSTRLGADRPKRSAACERLLQTYADRAGSKDEKSNLRAKKADPAVSYIRASGEPEKKRPIIESRHVKVLPPIEITIDRQESDTSLTDRLAGSSSTYFGKQTQQKQLVERKKANLADKADAVVPYIPARVKGLPPITLNIDSPLEKLGDMITSTASMQLRWAMFKTRVVAAPLHAANAVVGFVVSRVIESSKQQTQIHLRRALVGATLADAGIKKLAQVHPFISKNTQLVKKSTNLVQSLKLANQSVREFQLQQGTDAVKTWVKKKMPAVVSFVRKWNQAEQRMAIEIEECYGIPQKETRQFQEDIFEIATTAAFVGAGKGLSAARKAMMPAKSLSAPATEAGKWAISGIITPKGSIVASTVKTASERAILALGDGAIVLTRQATLSKTLKIADVATPFFTSRPKQIASGMQATAFNVRNKIASSMKNIIPFNATTTTASKALSIKDRITANIAQSSQARLSSGYRLFNPQIKPQKPWRNYTPYEPMTPSSMPHPNTAIAKSFHRRIESLVIHGQSYRLQMICTRFKCGTWSFFLEKITLPATSAISLPRTAIAIRSSLLEIAKNKFNASALIIQLDPRILEALNEVGYQIMKQSPHYAGELTALNALARMPAYKRWFHAAILGSRVELPKKAQKLGLSFKDYSDRLFSASQLTTRGSLHHINHIDPNHALISAIRALTNTPDRVPTLTFNLEKISSQMPNFKPLLRNFDEIAILKYLFNSLITLLFKDAHTKSVKMVLGKSKETVVVFRSTFDHNGALKDTFSQVQAFAHGRKLVFQDVTFPKQMRETLTNTHNVSHVIFATHAVGGHGIVLNCLYSLKAKQLQEILSHVNKIKGKKLQVILTGCLQGKRLPNQDQSLAEELFGRLKGEVEITASAGSSIALFDLERVRFFEKFEKEVILPDVRFFERFEKEVTVRTGRISFQDLFFRLRKGLKVHCYDSGFLRLLASYTRSSSQVLEKDLILVQCISGSFKNPLFLSPETAQHLSLKNLSLKKRLMVDKDGQIVASATAMRYIDAMKVIKIPAGQYVEMIEGIPLIANRTGLIMKGVPKKAVLEYCLYDMDPLWPSVTVPWPLPEGTKLADFDDLSAMYGTKNPKGLQAPSFEGALSAKPLKRRVKKTKEQPLVDKKIQVLVSSRRPAEESVVVIESGYDPSGVLRPIDEKVARLSQGRNLIYHRGVDSVNAIKKIMNVYEVSHILLRAHGNPSRIYFDRYGTTAEVLADALRKECLVQDKVAKVFLESCSTAAVPEGGESSFAHMLNNFLGDRAAVIAAKDPVYPVYTQMTKGNVSFYGRSDKAYYHLPSLFFRPEITYRIGRIDNSREYRTLLAGNRIVSNGQDQYFSEPPKIFKGAVPQELIFIQYHQTKSPPNKWFIGIEDAKGLKNLADIRTKLNITDVNYVTVTKIPAGDYIAVLKGFVTSQEKPIIRDIRTSSIKQNYFYDFDPRWESMTLPWSPSYETSDNWDALVEKALNGKVSRPILCLKS